MIRLSFIRPSETIHRTFPEEEFVLAPEDLPSSWELAWASNARLSLSLEDDGTLLVSNETGDPAVKFKGNILTSAYLMAGDAFSIGNTKICWSTTDQEVPKIEEPTADSEVEDFTDAELEELIRQAEALLTDDEPATAPAPLPTIHDRVRQNRTRSERQRAYLAASIAVILFIGFLSFSFFIHAEKQPSPSLLDKWAVQRQRALDPVTRDIVTLLRTNDQRPVPHFQSRLATLLESYNSILDTQARVLTAELSQLDSPFPQVAMADTLAELQAAVASAAQKISEEHTHDLKAQVNAYNHLRVLVLDRITDVLPPSHDPAELQGLFEQAHITQYEEQQLFQALNQ